MEAESDSSSESASAKYAVEKCHPMKSADESEEINFIKEGKAIIIATPNIFYNPVQEFNRDMSIAAIITFMELHHGEKANGHHQDVKRKKYNELQGETGSGTFTILEGLAATGLRSIRYALEIAGVGKVIANDCSSNAVKAMKENCQLNDVADLVEVHESDAAYLMHTLAYEKKLVDVVDLDPYGCPTQFLDAAVHCVKNGGLLIVTCTDMAVLCGNTTETCYAKYGSVSMRSNACHEMALRILLQCISTLCGRYGKYLIPMLSFSADFYIRVFVRIFSSQQKAKDIACNHSMVYQCASCNTQTLQPLCIGPDAQSKSKKYTLPQGPPIGMNCIHCGGKHKIGGPIWSGPLHERPFVTSLLELIEKDATSRSFGTSRRMIGMLSVILEELDDCPLYRTIDDLSSVLHCIMIPLVTMKSALLNYGYRVSASHCKSNSLKTDAPSSVIWDVMRCWVRQHPIAKKRLENNPFVRHLLEIPAQKIANFTIRQEARVASLGLVRYQQNPLPNWGPGRKSKSTIVITPKGSKI